MQHPFLLVQRPLQQVLSTQNRGQAQSTWGFAEQDKVARHVSTWSTTAELKYPDMKTMCFVVPKHPLRISISVNKKILNKGFFQKGQQNQLHNIRV